MANKILIKRGTRAQLEAAIGAATLNIGELYYITDEQRIAVGTANNNYQDFLKASESAPLDADLTAIAALTGTTGFLKKTAANTWGLDTNTYLTAEADTLGTVTGRGATTTTAVTFNGGITVDGTGAANFSGSASGSAKLVAPAAAGTGTVITLPSTTGTLALTSAIPTVNTGTLAVSIGAAGATNTSITWGTTSGFNANSTGSTTYDLKIGPAISGLASFMTTATAGFIRRTGQDTYGIDTNTYLTAEADTLGTVTGRGATTSTAATFSGGLTVNATSGTNGVNFVGQTSGSTKLQASAVAGTTTITLPGTTGTAALREDATFIGTTSVALNRASANLALTGISSIGLPTAGGGTVTVSAASTAAARTFTLPAASGTAALREDPISTFAAATGDIALGGFRITGLALIPGADSDAASKSYVDSVVQGIDTKASVRVATAATLGTVAYNNGIAGVGATLTNTGTLTALVVDGVTVALNDRILVKNQPTPAQNGIYTVTNIGSGSVAWILTRAADNDTWAEIPQAYVFVEQGTQENNGYLFTADQGGTIGTTDITITQFSGAGQITAGAGLTKTGNTIDVVGTANRITVAADAIDIASTYVGQPSITTLGTIGTGLWQGTQIGAIYGGTGQTTYATGDILYANGTNTLTKLTKPASLDSFLQMTAAGVPTWESTIDGGTF